MVVAMIAMRVMQVTVVQIVDVTVVEHGDVPAVGTVLMVMVGVMGLGA